MHHIINKTKSFFDLFLKQTRRHFVLINHHSHKDSIFNNESTSLKRRNKDPKVSFDVNIDSFSSLSFDADSIQMLDDEFIEIIASKFPAHRSHQVT